MKIKRPLLASLLTVALTFSPAAAPAALLAESDGNTGHVVTQNPSDTEKQANPVKPEIIQSTSQYSDGHRVMDGTTVVGGILLVNKQHPLPADYAPSNAGGAYQSMTLEPEADAAAQAFLAACNAQGNSMYVLSGYRSYSCQRDLFASYSARSGEAAASRYSARAGQSEHQTGLAFDVGDAVYSGSNLQIYSENTPGISWMMEHCADYGFILRYPKGKEKITGYQYEPWHYRYVGVAAAKEIQANGWTLEEFLGDTASLGDIYENGRRSAIGSSNNALAIDRVRHEVSAYNVDGNNYFRLRDLATLLEQADAHFDMTYDEDTRTIGVKTHTAYSGAPSLMQLETTDIAVPNTMAITVDGSFVMPASYNINGFTYYKLRDLGVLLDFGVEWDASSRTIALNTEGMSMISHLNEPVMITEG